jgi:hypothetical protein
MATAAAWAVLVANIPMKIASETRFRVAEIKRDIMTPPR